MRRCSDIGFGGNIDNCATCGYDGACNTGVGCGDKFACAARAIRDLGVGGTGGWGSRRWTNSVQPPTVVSTDTRSGAYHWAENDYSFIHLQDSPHFNLTNRDGSSLTAYCYNCEGGICHDYNSQSPITNGWLAGQLSAAAGAGRKVVLFMHQLYYNIAIWTDPQFMGLLTNNNVVAIFTGHTHDPEWMGTSATNTAGGYLPGGTTIPVFNSGAVWHNSFLQAKFDGFSLTVRVFDSNTQTQMLPGLKGPSNVQATIMKAVCPLTRGTLNNRALWTVGACAYTTA